MYNYWLGGKDHYEADRAVGDEVARCRPHVVAGARANRAFLARAVRYLAGDCVATMTRAPSQASDNGTR